MILFYGGHMSQWYPCSFRIDGEDFNCTEQWMMWNKATFFKDFARAEYILSIDDPQEQKAAGRRVSGFDVESWDRVSEEIVYLGNMAKYGQNPELRALLIGTGKAELVEASPTDRIWGIGLAEHDPRAMNKALWRGENRLGKVLMRVRESLR